MMSYTVIFQYTLFIHLNFFSFAFFRKPFSFSFHLTNYLPVLALALASVWWGFGRSEGWENGGSAADLPSRFSFRGDNVGVWKNGKR